jgi:hypothetical protein
VSSARLFEWRFIRDDPKDLLLGLSDRERHYGMPSQNDVTELIE